MLPLAAGLLRASQEHLDKGQLLCVPCMHIIPLLEPSCEVRRCGGVAAQTELNSFLIEISALILAFKDEDGSFLVNKILDKTGMKGTGAHL